MGEKLPIKRNLTANTLLILALLLTACKSLKPQRLTTEVPPTPTSAPTQRLDIHPTATPLPPIKRTPLPTIPITPTQTVDTARTTPLSLTPEQRQSLTTTGATIVSKEIIDQTQWRPFSEFDMTVETPGWFIVGDWSTIPVTGALLVSVYPIGSMDGTFITWSQNAEGNSTGGVVITHGDSRTRLDLTHKDAVLVDMGSIGIFALTANVQDVQQSLSFAMTPSSQ